MDWNIKQQHRDSPFYRAKTGKGVHYLGCVWLVWKVSTVHAVQKKKNSTLATTRAERHPYALLFRGGGSFSCPFANSCKSANAVFFLRVPSPLHSKRFKKLAWGQDLNALSKVGHTGPVLIIPALKIQIMESTFSFLSVYWQQRQEDSVHGDSQKTNRSSKSSLSADANRTSIYVSSA